MVSWQAFPPGCREASPGILSPAEHQAAPFDSGGILKVGNTLGLGPANPGRAGV